MTRRNCEIYIVDTLEKRLRAGHVKVVLLELVGCTHPFCATCPVTL